MITVDSRERKWEHIEKYFVKTGIKYEQRKLDVGDYALDGNKKLVIDRKQHLGELLTNLCSEDNSRFWRELRRASQQGIKILFLVEQNSVTVNGQKRELKTIGDVARSGWQSKYSRATCSMLADKMFKASMAYGCEWMFCDKRVTGKTIIDLLKGKTI